MGVGAGLYMYDVVVKCSRSLSHLLMSSCISRPTAVHRVVELTSRCLHVLEENKLSDGCVWSGC